MVPERSGEFVLSGSKDLAAVLVSEVVKPPRYCSDHHWLTLVLDKWLNIKSVFVDDAVSSINLGEAPHHFLGGP
jgi:hypothetical protein